MYSTRNKNKERFRTQVNLESTQPGSKEEFKPYATLQSSSARQPLSNSRSSSQPSILIIQNLQKHVEFIEKKLHEQQAKTSKLQNANQWLKNQILEKQSAIIKSANRLTEEEQKNKQLRNKYENLQADFANYQLQQKVDQLNRELKEQEELEQKSQNQSKSGKKDKFSSAFLPSPFGSPKHYEQKPSEVFENITKSSFPELNSTIKNPFQNSLWSEWRKMKNEKSRKQKQLLQLNGKLQETRQELAKQKKQSSKMKTQLLRVQQKSSTQISKLKTRIVNYIKDQKMLMNKLKTSQQKMFEFNTTMKEKGESECQKFFAHSSALQLQQIFQKITHNLEFDSNTVDITVTQSHKAEQQSQTEEIRDEKDDLIDKLKCKIKEIEGELTKSEKHWGDKLEENNNNYLSQLKDASDMMDLYKCRIEHLQKVAAESQKEKSEDTLKPLYRRSIRSQPQTIPTDEKEIMCEIIAAEEWQDRLQILNKVKALMELNEEQSAKISELQIEASKNQQNFHKQQREDRIMLAKAQEEAGIQDEQQNDCENCRKMKSRLLQKQMSLMESNKVLQNLQSQKNHFFQAYQDKLDEYSNLQQGTHLETQRLKNDLNQKLKIMEHLQYEVQVKNEEHTHQTEQIKQLKITIAQLQNKISVYQEQLQKLNQ